MSAVQGFRSRLNIGQRVARAAAEAFGLAGAVARIPASPADPAVLVPARTHSLFARHVCAHGTVSCALEIGLRGQDRAGWLPSGIRHDRLDVAVDGVATDLVAALRDIPTGSYDVVFSIDAIEHVRSPWRVADEIVRILRPGGLALHATVFTTRYQPQPEDYFRFTPDGLKSLFDGLECLTAEFDATDRPRRGARRGSAADIFGCSREGWRVNFCGRKTIRLR